MRTDSQGGRGKFCGGGTPARLGGEGVQPPYGRKRSCHVEGVPKLRRRLRRNERQMCSKMYFAF